MRSRYSSNNPGVELVWERERERNVHRHGVMKFPGHDRAVYSLVLVSFSVL